MRFFRGYVYGTASRRVGVWAVDENAAQRLISEGKLADAEEPTIFWEGPAEDLEEVGSNAEVLK